MSPVLNGIDVLERDGFAGLRGERVALLCNQGTVTRDGRYALDAMLAASNRGGFELVEGWGPQHGIWGHTQDNMIEWEGYRDARTGLLFRSLYGKTRIPGEEWFEKIDRVVIDIPDVGSKYYTFIWSMANCMEVAERVGKPVTILDRINPIGGAKVEGTVGLPEFKSFVGLYPLPMRHGMTAGEIARSLQRRYFPNVELDVIRLEGWKRAMLADETGLTWAMPSPNMPTVDTALVYPGGCLIEGTQLSEGRGTTRPFEIIGAPYLDGWKLAEAMNAKKLPGVTFRPLPFQPTFQKFAGKLCEGVFVHVSDRSAFKPVLTYVALIQEIARVWPEDFRWLDPPYEYEERLMPFDILAGNGWLRQAIEEGAPLLDVEARMEAECEAFSAERGAVLGYPD